MACALWRAACVISNISFVESIHRFCSLRNMQLAPILSESSKFVTSHRQSIAGTQGMVVLCLNMEHYQRWYYFQFLLLDILAKTGTYAAPTVILSG